MDSSESPAEKRRRLARLRQQKWRKRQDEAFRSEIRRRDAQAHANRRASETPEQRQARLAAAAAYVRSVRSTQQRNVPDKDDEVPATKDVPIIADSGSFCRLCLKTDSIEIVIPSPEEANESLLSIINECLSIWLTVTEDFPLAICHSCSMSIETIRQFRYNCQQCDFYLRSQRSSAGVPQKQPSVVDSDLDSSAEQKPVVDHHGQILNSPMVKQETYSIQEVQYEELTGVEANGHGSTVYGEQMNDQLEIAVKQETYSIQEVQYEESTGGEANGHGSTVYGGQMDDQLGIAVKQETYSIQEVQYEESISGEANGHGSTVYGGQMNDQLGMAVEQAPSEVNISLKKFDCPECGKQLYSSRMLAQHVVREHRLCHGCNNCGMSYNSEQKLLSHRESCSGRPSKFICTQCPSAKVFATAISLSMHLYYAHDSIKSVVYRCEACKKNFKNRTGLKYHYNARHGCTMVECEICRRPFPTEESLYYHKQADH